MWKSPSPIILFYLAALLSIPSSCFSVPVESYDPGHYLQDRTLDFLDMLDVKYALSIGVGAKIEASDYIAAGLGFGGLPYEGEFHGRRLEVRGPMFFYLLLFGCDGFDNDLYITTLFYQRPVEDRYPMMFRWRFGGEVVLPLIGFGAYINLVEIADFIVGLSGFDIADDDGVAKGAPLWDYVGNYRLMEPSEYIYWSSYVPEKLRSRNYRSDSMPLR